MSWESYIERVQELTDEDIQQYFEFKYRGGYYVQMKREACKHLRQKGYTTKRIASIVYGSLNRHDAVIHHLQGSKDFHKKDEVQINWRSWIKDQVYPISSENGNFNEETGTYYRMEYTLKHVSELKK